MNSVGILRLELLDVQSKMKYQAACSNLKQVSFLTILCDRDRIFQKTPRGRRDELIGAIPRF